MIAIAALAFSTVLSKSNGVNVTTSAARSALASAELSAAVKESSHAGNTATEGSSALAPIDSATASEVPTESQTTGATAAAAGRLLDQAAFGPTSTDILHVEQIGLAAYLQEQFAQPQTVLPEFPMDVGPPCDSTETCWGANFWRSWINDADQLRQRVAFALSHIFVTTTPVVGGYAMVPYYNLLINDAFSNWRTVMQDVTLSSVAGK